jgi:hypothetical protein
MKAESPKKNSRMNISSNPLASVREGTIEDLAMFNGKRVSNPPDQAAEPVVKCGYGSSDEGSHGKTTDTGRDSADCLGVCN